jgi:hypothetical protein
MKSARLAQGIAHIMWMVIVVYAMSFGLTIAANKPSSAVPSSTESSAVTDAVTSAHQTPISKLGRDIFERGIGRDGREIASLAAGGVRLRGEANACMNCHGVQGSGGGESWLRAPDIRWFALSKSYGERRVGDAVRPGYDHKTFARILRSGIASDDIALDPAMPRFDLADDEIDALIGHLAALNDMPSRTALPPALWTLLPEPSDPMAERIAKELQRCPGPTNSATVSSALPTIRILRYRNLSEAEARLAQLDREGALAAVFAPYWVGHESEFADAKFLQTVPVLLPVAWNDLASSAQLRYMLPNLSAQISALVQSDPEAASAQTPIGVLAPAMTTDTVLSQQIAEIETTLGTRTVRSDRPEALLQAGARRWLLLAPMPTPEHSAKTWPQEILVPSLFLQPDVAEAWRALGVTVRLSLPYRPHADIDARWIAPATALTALGCELLQRLPAMPTTHEGIPAWRQRVLGMDDLRLQGWLTLPAVYDAQRAINDVFVFDGSPSRGNEAESSPETKRPSPNPRPSQP